MMDCPICGGQGCCGSFINDEREHMIGAIKTLVQIMEGIEQQLSSNRPSVAHRLVLTELGKIRGVH